MPKHKQFLKSEKAKIKLKGAKLPKGLNVTKTEFKVKKIVIKEQLKGVFNEDGSIIRKQNVKELLSKLQHHNSTYRNEGLRYLKDILVNHPEEASKQFGAIIQGIAQLCLDTDKDVRKESFKALSILLSTSTTEKILPFFDSISSYLRCAMTHIKISVQEDSLLMLDSLLLYVPSLVAANSDKIFSNFLDMISKLRIESKPDRTLSVNLGSKITSVKWRSKVLERLLGMLKTMVKAKKNDLKFVTENISNSGDSQTEDAFANNTDLLKSQPNNKINYFNANHPMNFSLTRKHLNQNCDLPLLFRKRIDNGTFNVMFDIDEGKRIQKYATLLMPLIFETWMEVRPSNEGSEFDAHSVEPAVSLKIALEIIEHIYELITIWDNEVNNNDLSKWFSTNYNKDFCTHFLVAFPYSQSEGLKSSKRKSKGFVTEQEVQESGGQKCYQQNLTISFIFCCLNNSVKKVYHIYAEKITTYLKNNLRHGHSAVVSTALIKVLHAVLYDNGANWTKAKIHTKDLLASTILTYQNNKFPKEIRTKILILLCDIVLNWKLCNLYGNNLFESWLPSLPQMLCQQFVSLHVLKTFTCLAKQQNKLFLSNLEANMLNIIENLSKIQILGIENQFEGKKLIVNLFYWINNVPLNATDINEDKEICEYLKQIFMLKSIKV